MWNRFVVFMFLCVVTQNTHAQVKINEIMASNESTVADPQGEYDDWIELYNPTALTLDLAGLYLTDDVDAPTAWQFPLFEPELTLIEPGGYLLIWADDDAGDTGLHATFKLAAAGEAVGLFDADGLTRLDTIEFPEQRQDVSYGRLSDNASQWALLDTPTPGSANHRQTEGFVATPQVSVASRPFMAPFQVTMTCATEGAAIYYTLDGSDPHVQVTKATRAQVATLYQGPFSISQTTTLRAVALKQGWESSPSLTYRYVYTHTDVSDFHSNLPIMVVDTLSKRVGNNPVACVCFLFEPAEEDASIHSLPSVATLAGIDIRGQSSTGFPKKQYHLETWDQDSKDMDVAWLGLPAESDWVLNGPYSDKSLMRNALSYGWARDTGHYAPRTRFIELFLSQESEALSQSDYVGVYCLMEKIKISPNRVAIAKLGPGDVDDPDVTGGYIIKKDKDPTNQDTHFVTPSGQNLIYADPKGVDLNPAQLDWVRDYFNQFEAALYSPQYADPEMGYASFVDVNSWVDLHLLVELTKNIDGYRLSNYLTKDREGKLVAGPAWDYNLSLGNANYLDGWDPEGWYFQPGNPGSHPWWPRMFQDPSFRLRYADRWFAFRRDVFATERLLDRIDAYATLLKDAQQRNFERWRILGNYVWPNWFIANSYKEEIDWMKGWLTDRVVWMDQTIAKEYAPAPIVFSQQGGHVDWGYALWFASASDRIYYTLDGTDPHFSETGLNTVSLLEEDAGKRVLVPTGPVNEAWKGGKSFSDAHWMSHSGLPGGIGYERSSGYGPYIGLDVTDQMVDQTTSCYIRIAFTLNESPSDFDLVTLNMRYDDGFVAYLNGQEIARANVDHTPTWDSHADALNNDSQAVQWQAFSIADLKALRQGENILAIHGLNLGITSSDFLMAATLTAALKPDVSTDTDTPVYTDPIPLYESTHVKARAWSGGRWSALNEAVFAVGPVAESLRITELMYHAQNLGSGDDPNTEFIELTNTGTETINLNLVKFTAGIRAVLPSVDVAPGASVLVVKDIEAFAARYGPDLPMIGTYQGQLSNSGERLTLQDAAGDIIFDFDYSDNWFDNTDGQGYSLIVPDPEHTDPQVLSAKDAWQSSHTLHGSPGVRP